MFEIINKLLGFKKLGALYGKLKPESKECVDFCNEYKALIIQGKLHCIPIHIPNEVSGNKNKVFGTILSAQGKVRGCADYVFIKKDKCIFIEFKSGNNRQTQNQIFFEEWSKLLQIPYYIVYSKFEALEVLNKEGFISDINENKSKQ